MRSRNVPPGNFQNTPHPRRVNTSVCREDNGTFERSIPVSFLPDEGFITESVRNIPLWQQERYPFQRQPLRKPTPTPPPPANASKTKLPQQTLTQACIRNPTSQNIQVACSNPNTTRSGPCHAPDRFNRDYKQDAPDSRSRRTRRDKEFLRSSPESRSQTQSDSTGSSRFTSDTSDSSGCLTPDDSASPWSRFRHESTTTGCADVQVSISGCVIEKNCWKSNTTTSTIQKVACRALKRKRAVFVDAVDIALPSGARLQVDAANRWPRRGEVYRNQPSWSKFNAFGDTGGDNGEAVDKKLSRMNLLPVHAIVDRLRSMNVFLVVAAPYWLKRNNRDKLEEIIECSGDEKREQVAAWDEMDKLTTDPKNHIIVHYYPEREIDIIADFKRRRWRCLCNNQEEVEELMHMCMKTDSLLCSNNEKQFLSNSCDTYRRSSQEMTSRLLPYFKFGRNAQIVSDPRGRGGLMLKEMLDVKHTL